MRFLKVPASNRFIRIQSFTCETNTSYGRYLFISVMVKNVTITMTGKKLHLMSIHALIHLYDSSSLSELKICIKRVFILN